MAQAMRRDNATWAVREQCGRQHEPNKKAPLFFKSAPIIRPVHRTPHAATASRPAHRDDRETPLINGAR